MKFYFPLHLDGDNRGCEGIAKGTAEILGESKESLVGFCRNVKLDVFLGTDEYVSLVEDKRFTFSERILNLIRRHLFHNAKSVAEFCIDFLKEMKEGDIMLSTGGDMMCYSNNHVIDTNDYVKSRGLKSILWGCSMGPENLTPEKELTLRKFDLIYSRESLSYNFFKELGLENVVCLPDPAFVLEPQPTELPSVFNNGDSVVGINISNYVLGGFSLDSKFAKSVCDMIEHILKNTSHKILLIPHVLWKGQDDRIVAKIIVEHYKDYSERFAILDSAKLNYLQIRYVISKCYCFIGARTHAVISAYSTCVPSIAIGYSIKAKGIAKDLGLPDESVVDSRMGNGIRLKDSFIMLTQRYDEIKNTLESVMPEYRKRPFEIRNKIY